MRALRDVGARNLEALTTRQRLLIAVGRFWLSALDRADQAAIDESDSDCRFDWSAEACARVDAAEARLAVADEALRREHLLCADLWCRRYGPVEPRWGGLCPRCARERDEQEAAERRAACWCGVPLGRGENRVCSDCRYDDERESHV